MIGIIKASMCAEVLDTHPYFKCMYFTSFFRAYITLQWIDFLLYGTLHLQIVCEGLPPAFAKFLTVTRTLPFEAEPDYEGYQKMFEECMVSEGENT